LSSIDFTALGVTEEQLQRAAELVLAERRENEFLLTEPYLFHEKVLCPERLRSYLRPFHKDGLEWATRKGGKRLKLILWPRGHLKSTIFTQGESIRLATLNPNIRILINASKADLGETFLTSIKGTLASEEYVRRYGNVLPNNRSGKHFRNNQKELTFLTRTNTSLKEPTITISGLDATKTSQHYDVIFHDDLVMRENVGNFEMMDKVWKVWQDSLDLLEPDGVMFVIGTRWHPLDLYGRILSDYVDERCFDGATTHHVPHCKCHFDVSILTLKNEKGDYIFDSKFDENIASQLRTVKGVREFCTPADAPILMSDFSEKPIALVEKGDTIIGFGEHSKLFPVKVLDTGTLEAEVFEYVMSDGSTIRCTKEHKWFRRWGRPYVPAVIGSRLVSLKPLPPVEHQREWDWLGGFLDGEGAINALNTTSAIMATQSIANTVCCERLEKCLATLNIPYSRYYRDNSSRPNWSDSYTYSLNGGWELWRKLLAYTNMAKKKQLIQKLLFNSASQSHKTFVVSMRSLGVQPVYWLKTESGNYISQRYFSSNSAQYENNPANAETVWFNSDDIKASLISASEINNLRNKLVWYMMVDPAESIERRSSYTAVVCVGVDHSTGHLYVDYATQSRVDTAGFINLIFDAHFKMNPHRFAMEKTTRKALEYVIKDKMAQYGRFFSIEDLNPALGNAPNAKETRIRSLRPLFEAKRIHINENLTDLISILYTIPSSPTFDLPDVLSYIFQLVPQGLGAVGAAPNQLVPVLQNKGLQYAVSRRTVDPITRRCGTRGESGDSPRITRIYPAIRSFGKRKIR